MTSNGLSVSALNGRDTTPSISGSASPTKIRPTANPEHHERRAHYYAESKEWKVKEVYHLEAVSGKSVKDHPETQRMMKDIKLGHITGLIFSKLARLARNTRELLDFADTFREHNADLISLQESIDTSTPAEGSSTP